MTDKEKFFKHLTKVLSSFTKDSEQNIWTFEQEYVRPGATIIVNGQKVEQPEQKQKVKVTVDATAEGSVEDVQFCQLSVTVEQSGQKMEYPDECIPYFDVEYLDAYLNSIL